MNNNEAAIQKLQNDLPAILAEKRPLVISGMAETYGLPELDICRALPEDMRSIAGNEHFAEIWQELTTWELTTFIVIHLGNAIEIKCKIPKGAYGHGYFNLHGDSPLGGHLRSDDISAICFASIPFIGLESHSVQFYNHSGALMFSVYVGRQKHELIPAARESFLRMKNKYALQKKNLVVYSSLTGNTKMIAESIAEILPNSEIYSIDEAPHAEGYSLVAVGYWVDKGMPDAKSKKYIESITNANVALFGTLGAWPDSDHAKDCIEKSEALLKDDGKNNNVLGSFICQGKVDPALTKRMDQFMGKTHPMTPERQARLEEAAKHPNENDCQNAQNAFKEFVSQLGI